MIPWTIDIVDDFHYKVGCLMDGGEKRTFTLEMKPGGTMAVDGGFDEMSQIDQVQTVFITRTVMALHQARQTEKLLKTA
jgi:hypothetical protein